jgi:DNA-binding transcriptional regulator YiaG
MTEVTRGTYRFKESGISDVFLKGIELVKCHKCGNIDPIIPRTNDLMRVLALAVISQPNRLRGAHVRFLRKFIGKTGEEFSKLLHVDPATLSKWENDEDRVGPQSDRLIRTIVLALSDGLKKELEAVINSFPAINEHSRQKQIEIDPGKMSYEYA